MNVLDWAVLLGTMVGIAAYGVWRTRGRRNLEAYLRGAEDTKWFVVGLSVMATQASAITFLSTPGQGYESGLGFVQNYFGAPFALIIISAVFLPIYRRLKVYTAYEYLGQRFDSKTRLLGAGLFLLQRGLGAGITIYAPAIVLSTVMGWRLDLTILCSGLVVIAYTVAGGSDAVNHTQKYQLAVIFAGMVGAFVVLLAKLPAGVGVTDALALAGGMGKLRAVDFSLSTEKRYTFWSGLLGGMFLALSYFGTDQSQVQRYLSGASVRESRLGLMFNAVCKIPMQFFILLLGALLFVFYQFERPPMFFNDAAWTAAVAHDVRGDVRRIEGDFERQHADRQRSLREWIDARHAGDAEAERAARGEVVRSNEAAAALRTAARKALPPRDAKVNDVDYVFIHFVLTELPHGLVGLLIAAFFAATFSSKAAELNALASTTTVDLYRHTVVRGRSDRHYVVASKLFTVMWGGVALAFALFASLAENLIQAVNIVGSIFYGVVLGMFLVAFFLKRVHGTAVFWGATVAQGLVFVLYYSLNISYLWYNVIGCAACVVLAASLQVILGPRKQEVEASVGV